MKHVLTDSKEALPCLGNQHVVARRRLAGKMQAFVAMPKVQPALQGYFEMNSSMDAHQQINCTAN